MPSLRESAEAAASAMDAVAALLASPLDARSLDLPGLPVFVSEYVERGKCYLDRTKSARLWFHPLDVIYVEHENDPNAQLAAIEAYIVARAHRELDALEQNILAGSETLAFVDIIPDTSRFIAALAASVKAGGRP